jgi:cysteine synthase A
MKYANSVVELIGNTPLVKLKNASKETNNLILGKCEFLNPTHSVKDRIGLNMIQDALNSGKMDKSTTIIEPTSGNTGIGLASVCASYGIELILTMPESMSLERRKLLTALGAKIVLTEASAGMSGAVAKANELVESMDNAITLQQFQNPSNPDIHTKTTAQEILNDTTEKIDIFIAGVGTGGTITGIARALKEYNMDIKIIAVEPKQSAVISGNQPAPHKIQGIGAGFIPKNYDNNLVDEVIQVDESDAIITARNLAKEEGLLVGISSGANVYASTIVGKRKENNNKNIVTILCDTGERYLSTSLYQD